MTMTVVPPAASVEPRVTRVALAFLREVGDGEVRYAVLDDWRWLPSRTHAQRSHNGAGATVPSLDVLVGSDDLVALDVVARRRGLVPEAVVGALARVYELEDGGRWRIRVRPHLWYGGARPWLATGADESHVVRRADEVEGVALLAPSDRLVHLVLTCLLDVGAFPVPYRQELIALMERLRADPPAAGRAAERVQQELAPALDWSTLLADIVHGRWSDVLARSGALRRQLWRRAPLASTARWLRGWTRGLAGLPVGRALWR